MAVAPRGAYGCQGAYGAARTIHPALCPHTCWPLARDQLCSSKSLPHPGAFSMANTRTGRLLPRQCSPPQAKVRDRALALSLSKYCVSFIHAARPACPRKLRTAAQADHSAGAQSIAQQSCPALSSTSVSSSHVKTTEEHYLSVLVFLAIFL